MAPFYALSNVARNVMLYACFVSLCNAIIIQLSQNLSNQSINQSIIGMIGM